MAGSIDIKKTKTELRKTVKFRLAAVAPQQFAAAGRKAAGELVRLSRWNEYRSVLVFISIKDEIDTRPIITAAFNSGKFVFAPKTDGDDPAFYQIGQNGSHTGGILRPEDFPALVITPGLAFDRSLNRLGRGRSFYDRFFAAMDASKRNYTALGLCLDCQLFDEVPMDPWDKKLDMLLTESGFILPP